LARQPEWFQQIPEAIERLAAFPAPVLDRAALERLMGVGPRTAIRLLHRFGAWQAGHGLLISAPALREQLVALADSPPCRQDLQRRRRLADLVETTGRDWRARGLRVTEASAGPAGLPAGVTLEAGRLEARFGTLEDLLGQLLALARAIPADPEQFRRRVQGPDNVS